MKSALYNPGDKKQNSFRKIQGKGGFKPCPPVEPLRALYSCQHLRVGSTELGPRKCTTTLQYATHATLNINCLLLPTIVHKSISKTRYNLSSTRLPVQ